MKLIDQSWSLIAGPDYRAALGTIARAASTCYKSHPKDPERFIRSLIKSGHTSTMEHVSFTFKIITDRAVSHELVRHRIASYSQESQRYCAYKEDVHFIKPHWYDVANPEMQKKYELSLEIAEEMYKSFLEAGFKPQDARGVLPNATATEIVATFNIRSLLNLFVLRTAMAAHPDIRRLTRDMLDTMQSRYPAFFGHIDPKNGDKGHGN